MRVQKRRKGFYVKVTKEMTLGPYATRGEAVEVRDVVSESLKTGELIDSIIKRQRKVRKDAKSK